MTLLAAIIVTLLICGTVITVQVLHYYFKREERDHKDVARLSEQLEKRLEEFDELKAKVNQMSLRIGFGR